MGKVTAAKTFWWGWDEISWGIAVLPTSPALYCSFQVLEAVVLPGLGVSLCHATMLLTLQGLFWFSVNLYLLTHRSKVRMNLCVSWVRNCNLTYFLDAKIVKRNFWCSLAPVHFLWRIFIPFFPRIRSNETLKCYSCCTKEYSVIFHLLPSLEICH